jgi:ADP-ribosylglycohydrolase
VIGAIVGDIVGSIYEFHNLKLKEFELFTDKNFFTDDSVLTCATAEALLRDQDFARHYREYTMAYPGRGYGAMYIQWAHSPNGKPYMSFGNGSAMRVSPVAYAAKSVDEVLSLARSSAEVTHSHPEGIKGAQAVALAVFLARTGVGTQVIQQEIEGRFEYRFDRSLDEIRKVNRFDETCQGTVPVALACVFAGESFEDVIRNSVSVGGDTDTICCIAGGIAESLHGVPQDIHDRALKYLTPKLKAVIEEFDSVFKR